MKTKQSDWLKLLTDAGVPQTIAREAVAGKINPAWGRRIGLMNLILGFLLMAGVVTFLVVHDNPCTDGRPLNLYITALSLFFSALSLPAWGLGYAQSLAPLSVRKSAFVGMFTNAQNYDYAIKMTNEANRRIALDADFLAYERAFGRGYEKLFAAIATSSLLFAIAAYLFIPQVYVS
ncbi:MAG: hypothetical protein AAFX02_01500 [Pseudomonadota bacterium]